MQRTYATLYENEERAVEITIRDQDDVDFEPSGVFAEVRDTEGGVVLPEATCMVVANKAYAFISDTVTGIPGKYEVVWRIMKTVGEVDYKYFHKTELLIEEL
jgi:hypothetical protein